MALVDDMLLQLSECLSRTAGAHERTTDDHITLTLFDVGEPILQLEYLIAVSALYANLINDIVEISVLLLRVKHILTLAALGATLV